MNPKEKLKQLIAELKSLEPKIAAMDEEAMKRAEELTKNEIPAMQEQVKQYERAQQLADTIKGFGIDAEASEGDEAEAEPVTLGQKAVAALKKSGYTRDHRGFTVVSDEVKAATDPNVRPAGAAAQTPSTYGTLLTDFRDYQIEGHRRPLTVASLFSQETTTRDSVTYSVFPAVEGTPGTIAEGGAYGQLHIGTPATRTDSIHKIGAFWKDTDELLEDYPRLAQAIDNYADYMMDIAEEDQLLKGDGTGNNIQGLLNRSGLQVGAYTTLDSLLLLIKHCRTAIRLHTPGFRADGILIGPALWEQITDLQDDNKQFRVGGPFSFGPYGQGGYNEEHPLWNLRVVPSEAIGDEDVVVGAFRLGGSVIRRTGRRVEVTNSEGNDFTHGLITMRTTERVGLAVRYPAAFVKITHSTGAGAAVVDPLLTD